MSAFEVNILGKDAAVKRLQAIRSSIAPRLKATMMVQMSKLADYVRSSKLSGQVLKNRTGTLRRSIHPSVTSDDTTITGFVGTNVSYAGVHELGGTFNVPAHWREQTMAFGKPIAPRSVQVRAHMATFPQRAFLRPSMNEQRDDIIDALRATTREVVMA